MIKLLWILVLVTSQSSAEIFSVEPRDQTVPLESTSNIEFSCKATVENPVYSWRKDDQPLDTSNEPRYETNGGTLTIMTPQAVDEGGYQCVVTSSDGIVVSNYGNLVFAYIHAKFPDIQQQPEVTSQGKGIAIQCPNIAYEPPWSVSFYWEKMELDFITLKTNNNTHFVSQTDGTLYLANPVVGDSGKFSCRIISNWKVGGVKQERKANFIQLKVDSAVADMPATFLRKPEPVTTAIRGGKAMLQCYAGGRPTPIISWSKQDEDLPANHKISNSGQLILEDITEDMAGTYLCTAENNQRTVTSKGQLQLQYKPQWTAEISSAIVEKSSSAKFICSALGNPKAQFLWLKDGQQLKSNEDMIITDTQYGSEVEILSVNVTDEGMYQCVGYNEHGYIFSSARLTIATDPPVFNQPMDDVTKAALHSDVIINCDVTAAPDPVFQWSKDSESLDLAEERYSLIDGKLQISNVNASDAGEYMCTASNSLGMVSGITSLKVFSPTEVTQHTVGEIDLEAGEAIMLECFESHDIQLEIEWSWTQNNETINVLSKHYKMTGGVLELLDVGSEQIGTYKCCASTDVGEDCAEMFVDVLAPPDPPSNVRIESSSSTTQTIVWSEPKTNGAPIIQYEAEVHDEYNPTWFQACTSNTTSCTVSGLLPYNNYVYRVYAFNKMGRGGASEKSARASTLTGAPSAAPTGISGGGGKPGQLVVNWEPFQKKYYGSELVTYTISMRKEDPGDPVNLPIDIDGSPAPPSDKPWFDKVELDSGATQTIFEVNASEIFRPYEVKVRAENPKGVGPFSNLAVVFTAEIPPDQSPTGFTKKQAKAYSAEITWNYLPNTNGYTKGYQVSICSMIDFDPCDNPKQWKNFTTPDEKPHIKIEDLQPNYNYKLRAAGFNTAGLGPWSDSSFHFVTAGPPPNNAPMNVVLKVVGQDLSAYWDAVQKNPFESDIQGYVIQYWWLNQTSADARDHYTSIPQVDFKLPEFTDYNLWIRAFNEGGNGRPSAHHQITTQKGISAGQGGGSSAVKFSSFLMLLCAWRALGSWLN